jgi:D-hydroxyproline dehydrogenase subunit beta
MQKAAPRIAVIGGGVIGLSIARAAALQGARVTVFEQAHLGAGTSSTTFAWINSNGKTPEPYHRLNCAGMEEHRRLQQHSRSSARWLESCGTFEWATSEAEHNQLDARAQKLQALNYPAEEVSRSFVQERVPELRIDRRARTVWHFPSEALVAPSMLMAHLWAEARAHGAEISEHTEVIDIAERSDGVTLRLSSDDVWEGDFCVLAMGRWTPKVITTLGVSLAMLDTTRPDKRACGFLALTDPQLVQLGANLITPELNVRPEGGGRLLLQAIDLDDRADPAHPASIDGSVGREFLQRLRSLFANTAHARIERLSVGQRSRPADGLPAIGFVTQRARAYVVATHSGMTLGPLLGRLVAQELINGERHDLLADFAPSRLLNREASEFSPVASIHYPAEQ